MDWLTVLQTLVNALVASAVYAAIAVGLALCFGIMRMANFAHGELFMLGAYVVYTVYAIAGLPYPLAVLGAGVIVGFVGLLVERSIFRPTKGNVLAGFMATAGLALILQVVVGELWGVGIMREIPTPYMGALSIFGAAVGWQRVLVVPSAFAMVALLWLFLKRARLGQGLRACAQDAEAAALQGVSITRMSALAMVIAGLFAGVAGALMAPIHPVTPYMGHAVILMAFIVVVVGGMASIEGTILAAVLLGFVHTIFSTIFDSVVATMIGVVVMVIVLVAMPKGLLGRAKA